MYSLLLNGISLQAISKDIVIVDIGEKPLLPTLITAQVDAYARLVGTNYPSKEIVVSFLITQNDPTARMRILQDITRLVSRGGRLALSTRPNQVATVQVSRFPCLVSAKQWTNTFDMAFTATYRPFFEDEFPTRAYGVLPAHESTPLFLCPKGSIGARLEATLHLQQGVLTTCSFQANDQYLHFRALHCTKQLIIDYDDHGFLRVTGDGHSVYPQREGADELWLACQKETMVCVQVDAPCHAKLSARGLYW